MHITGIATGDFVRVCLFSRKPLVYKHIGSGAYELVVGEPSKRDKIWDAGVVQGGVISNDVDGGILRIGVVNQQSPEIVYRAIIPYSSINMLHIAVVTPVTSNIDFLKNLNLPPRIKYERVKF